MLVFLLRLLQIKSCSITLKYRRKHCQHVFSEDTPLVIRYRNTCKWKKHYRLFDIRFLKIRIYIFMGRPFDLLLHCLKCVSIHDVSNFVWSIAYLSNLLFYFERHDFKRINSIRQLLQCNKDFAKVIWPLRLKKIKQTCKCVYNK